MRFIVTIALCTLLGLIQYTLWYGDDSSYAYAQVLSQRLGDIQAKNDDLRMRTAALRAELKDLQTGNEILEEHARTELDMIKPNEILIKLYDD